MIGRFPTDLCSSCSISPHTSNHVFTCPLHPTQLRSQDIWERLRLASSFLHSLPFFCYYCKWHKSPYSPPRVFLSSTSRSSLPLHFADGSFLWRSPLLAIGREGERKPAAINNNNNSSRQFISSAFKKITHVKWTLYLMRSNIEATSSNL